MVRQSVRSAGAKEVNAGTGGEPASGKPTPLFADEYGFGYGAIIGSCDVTRQGRFLMLRRGASGGGLRAITNWTKELEQILAAGGRTSYADRPRVFAQRA